MDEEAYVNCVDNMRIKARHPARRCRHSGVTDHHAACLCKQGSDLLFGLPIVLDTNSEDFKIGQKAWRGHACTPRVCVR
jgi:hypothetical protein